MRLLALSAAFCIALALSVGLKIPGLVKISEGPSGGAPLEIDDVLAARSFQVSRYVPDNDLTWISGINDDCRLMVAAVAPQGWHRALVAQMAQQKQVFYVFDGQVYSEQPIVRTRAYHYWRKLARYFGLTPRERPVLAVLSTPSCQDVPLAQLAAFSAGGK